MLEIPDVFKGLLILICVFVPIEKIWSMHKQNLWRDGTITDLCYYFAGFFIGKGTTQLLIIVALLSQGSMPILTSFTSQQPLILQVPVAIFIGDLSFYILHRLMHTVPWLWKFHVIHHSSEQIDWLSTVRVHPFEQILTKACQMIPLYWLGFSTQALAIYAIFSSAIAFFIHANIQIKIPIIKWIIATPEFHRWHHASSPELSNKNLAVQLPIIDYLFGTFHLSSEKSPSKYGSKLKTKTSYFKHLSYPFIEILKI
ncbi:sterol desaturase family protein [Pseudanabaena sp. FACHB-1998]|uniref:sterol desaturase family protein n=1 Tax=Pseudanabaena sp. FACHB-1998 TaxID=2692858 RepID=UPI001681B88E|nr:sterol desaturase family protein [Pseudanabaena sp. FACHB-1998]MBD2178813.1 sterol desaturase family protein [Pseudanabaena sp. FACHB-1998]